MKSRIPLQIVEGRLILKGVIRCPKLRIPYTLMDFVIDTGSQDSFISHSDVLKLQIPMKNRTIKGEVEVGGSRYKQIKLPHFSLYLLKEDIKSKHTLKVSFYALKTTKTSDKKKQIAYSLPSILGTDFLKHQKISLHVLLHEDLAYLEFD